VTRKFAIMSGLLLSSRMEDDKGALVFPLINEAVPYLTSTWFCLSRLHAIIHWIHPLVNAVPRLLMPKSQMTMSPALITASVAGLIAAWEPTVFSNFSARGTVCHFL